MARRNYDPKFTGNTATANQLRPMPEFQKTRRTPTNQQQFVESLDELLRRNKGGFTAIGQETSSNIPFFVGNRAPQLNPTGIQQNKTQASEFTPRASSREAAQLPEAPYIDTGIPDQINNLEQFFNALDYVTQAQPQQLDFPMFNDAQAVGSHQSGGRIYSDGSVRYADGTIITAEGKEIVPIRSNADGSVGYSDGSSRFMANEAQPIASIDGNRVLYSDGSVRYGNYIYDTVNGQTPGGQLDLIRGIFGQDRDITQQYGNYNPSIEPGSGYNRGTDIRTRDLQGNARQLKLPVQAEVVGITFDDGTRFGDQSGHQGYGNSVLVRLPSGEYLRFAHLDSIANLKEGDIIGAGQVFGTPGTTGNTYGEHLDLEYYTADGQIANPSQFSGFTNPASIMPGQNVPGAIADTSDLPEYLRTPEAYMSYANGQKSQTGSQPNAQNGQIPTPMTDMVTGAVDTAKNVAQNVGQAVETGARAAGNTFANAVEKANPTGEYGVGLTELARGDRQAAGAEINRTGQKLAEQGILAGVGNSPEGFIGAGEAVAGDLPAAGRELSSTIERVNLTPRIDTGLSELARGDIEGAKKNFADTTRRVAARLQRLPGEVGREIIQPAYAAETGQPSKIETLGENIKGAASSVGQYINDKAGEAKSLFTDAVSKPMEGLKGLKDEFVDTANKFNPFNFDPSKMAGDRKVGDEGGFSQNQLSATLARPEGEKNDIRDPFFKLGGAEKFNQFIKPGSVDNSGGALSLGLFNNDFYSDPNRIAEVFGSTSMVGDATDKYKQSVRDQYGSSFESDVRSKYPTDNRPGETSYDEGSVRDYIKQVRDSVEKYLGGLQPFKTAQATYQDFRPGATNPVKPGQNFSPYVSVAQQIAKMREGAESDRGMTVGTVMEQALKPVKNLFSSITAPKAATPKVNLPQISFNVSTPKVSRRPTLEDYLGMGKTAAQFYAETGQQSVADSAGGAQKAANAYFDSKRDAYVQNAPSTNSSQDPRAVQRQAVDDSILAASQGKPYYSNTGNRIYNYSPANANMTDAGTGLPVYGGSPTSSSTKSNPGIFSQAAGLVKRLFNF